MWKEMDQPDMGLIRPSQGEIKEVLKIPTKAEQSEKHPQENGNYILWVQIGICLVLIASVLAIRQIKPTAYEKTRVAYKFYLQQGVEISGQEELVKFASAALEEVRLRTSEMMQQVENQTATSQIASVGIAAGILSFKKPQPPEGCSTEQYQPEQTLKQPIAQYTVTSEYGWRIDSLTKKQNFHTGIDLATQQGTKITSALPGIVQKTAYNSSYGNYVLVSHQNGVATRYCHMQYVFVRQGQRVTQEDILGTVGQTGAATGPHLHFELIYNDVNYNPDSALGLEQ